MPRDFRRRPFNASDFQRALEYRRLGFANHEIADALGCADQTLYAALRDVPEWRADWDEATEASKAVERESKASCAERLMWGRADSDEKGATPILIELFRTYVPEAQRATRVEVSGPQGEPIQIEGRRVVSIADVIAFADKHGIELGGGDAQRALPAAPDVLPDPPDS